MVSNAELSELNTRKSEALVVSALDSVVDSLESDRFSERPSRASVVLVLVSDNSLEPAVIGVVKGTAWITAIPPKINSTAMEIFIFLATTARLKFESPKDRSISCNVQIAS